MEIKMRYAIGAIVIIGALLIAGCSEKPGVSSTGEAIKMTMYKSPSCGCCAGYATEMEKNGFDVEVISMDNINSVKMEHGVPQSMNSCHTSVIGEYVIEGHVPVEAVTKLLAERPAVDGLAVPGMPSGVAGMPGPKRSDIVVYTITDGTPSEYMKV